MNFLKNIKNYLIIGAVVALITLAGVALTGWKMSADLLEDTQTELRDVKSSLATSEDSVTKLKEELALKGTLNFQLGVELVNLSDGYAEDIKTLSWAVEELKKRRPQATTVVDSKQYVEERYVNDVAETVLGSMWDRYCKVPGNVCPESIQQ